MNNFEFYIPTKIVFGVGTLNTVGANVGLYGEKALLASYDKELLQNIGIYEKITGSLKSAGVEIVEFYGIKSNPVISHVNKGADLAKKEKVDVILAVGGGSVIDECKVISAAALYDGNAWDFFSGAAEVRETIPLVTVLTIPATSSEMNSGAVITNEETKHKSGFFNPAFFPKVSILDPSVTYSLSQKLTAFAAADIMSHLLEGYLTHKEEWVPIQDGLMETLMKAVIKSTDRIEIDPKDQDARATMMWAGSLAWNGLPVAGVGAIGYPMHMFEHTLSAIYDIHHGAGMAVIMPGWMKYDCSLNNKRYILFARNVFGIKEKDDSKAAEAGIEAFRKWLIEKGAPVSFKSANLPAVGLDKLADDVIITAQAWGMEDWYSKETIIEIFKRCTE
ncbi:MAG: iron-containing alcohol dehydrogenase [Candidatus Humimicrobiaceae bacterium]